ncbi:MAG: hypothetical protein JRI46_07830 [Deltaproteobacteria bacterium]|nr:hypothetical protein [Deltaproteobacteria bacterium]
MKVERVLVVLVILIIFFGCQCEKNRSVPNDLIGMWKTSAPKYADRLFEFKKDAVIFGTGEGNFDTYAITNIEIEKIREEKGILYTIYYENREGEEYKFSFYYYPENRGVIRFKNQKQIMWTKEKS